MPSGSYSASSITIINLYAKNKTEKHSIGHVGDGPLLTQAGLSLDNKYLFVVRQQFVSKYLSLCIFEINSIPTITFNVSTMKTQVIG